MKKKIYAMLFGAWLMSLVIMPHIAIMTMFIVTIILVRRKLRQMG